MRLFVTGSSGLLGAKVAEIATYQGHKVYSGYHNSMPRFGKPVHFSLLDETEIRDRLTEIKPDVVIHCAAMSNVDECEQNPDLAFRINAAATEAISSSCDYMIYVSTDYVFDGVKGFYTEFDHPNPINVYGASKLAGEQFCDNVARTSTIFGNNRPHWSMTATNPFLVADQYLTPTLNSNLARMLLEMADRRLSGTYHLAGASRLSRLEFIQMIAANPALAIMGDLCLSALRPKDSSLDTSRASKRLKNRPLLIDEAIMVLKNS